MWRSYCATGLVVLCGLLLIGGMAAAAVVVANATPSPDPATPSPGPATLRMTGPQPTVPQRVAAAPAVAASGAVNHAGAVGVPAPTRQGAWTPQIGVQIAERALRWLSWPYSFDGGDANGPTRGIAVDHDSRNDASIVGFDCSGLVLYALAPWISVDHFAASQYLEAGHAHPSLNELLPGDLVFWSADGTVNGVGHVAIYIGNGQVVQAPHSGAYVDIAPLGQVEAGIIGTTRPLS